MPGTDLRNGRVGVLTEGKDHGVSLERLDLAGRNRIAVLVELHDLDMKRCAVNLFDRAQPVDLDAFFNRLVSFKIVRRHLVARPAVNDERLGAEPGRRSCRVHRRVATAVDGDATADARRLPAGLDLFQELKGVVDLAGVARRNLLTFAEMRADGEEHGVESTGVLLGHEIGDLAIEDDLDADAADALDLAVEHFPRQPVPGDAEVHHPARHGTSLVDDDFMSAPCQMPGGRKAARTGAHDEDATAARAGGREKRTSPRSTRGHRGTARRRGC